jgi:hypothetical protein
MIARATSHGADLTIVAGVIQTSKGQFIRASVADSEGYADPATIAAVQRVFYTPGTKVVLLPPTGGAWLTLSDLAADAPMDDDPEFWQCETPLALAW